MRSAREIIISPMITEKSTVYRNINNCYTFKVSINANKIEIKKAIETIFDVNVLSVNTVRQLGKTKRVGRYVGKKADWKKAIIKLKKGDSIPEFDL